VLFQSNIYQQESKRSDDEPNLLHITETMIDEFEKFDGCRNIGA